jgi:endogenous inhibitor of DNA gyrase (YacG/DUF329 family)
MADNPETSVACPSCGTTVSWIEANEQRPFCSKRCRNLDFCGWANESHVIGGDGSHSDIFSEDLE